MSPEFETGLGNIAKRNTTSYRPLRGKLRPVFNNFQKARTSSLYIESYIYIERERERNIYIIYIFLVYNIYIN